MSNVINYNPFTFTDADIISGSVAMQNALMFDSLNPDELTVDVVCDETGNAKLLTNSLAWYHTVNNEGYVVLRNDIRNFTYGDPLYYYYNGVLQGKFYMRSVDRLSVDHFRLNAFSLVGILSSVQHLGGIYDGETAGNIIANLLSGYTYTIAPDVASVELYGWLPVASIRDNLQQVLFAVGASLYKDANGNPYIHYIDTSTTIPISDDRIFIGGTLSYRTPATQVTVTEHSFYESTYDVEVSLFDNTDGSGYANNKLILFEEPCHNLTAVGLTVNSSGANYAYVTGTGTLTGKKYTHTTRQVVYNTGRTGEQKESKVEHAYLVSVANSANVAARVSAYESTAEEVACGIVLSDDNVKTGSLVSFTDPYGEATTGIISEMKLTMSGKSKGDCVIVKNYVPTDFGNNYENVDAITSNGTWTVPAGVDRIRIVLIGGGQAGQNGANGENGQYNTILGGAGGQAGQGGSGGDVFVYDIDNPTGTVTVTIGTGGTAGSGSLAYGNGGSATTAVIGGTTYSSADGAPILGGYRDVLTSNIYGAKGISGLAGSAGGNGGRDGYGKAGFDFTYNGTTWTGGLGGSGGDNRWGDYGGGGGGGAAYGANGNNGANGHSGSMSGSGYLNRGGRGGNGADALSLPITSVYGAGGVGGCGGGGGGGGGYWSDVDDDDGEGVASGGTGGAYSNGCNGGDGIALFYY